MNNEYDVVQYLLWLRRKSIDDIRKYEKQLKQLEKEKGLVIDFENDKVVEE